jgi:hypothetical protein
MSLQVIKGGTPAELGTAEYIWVDGVGDFHSKTRVIGVYPGDKGLVPRIENWETHLHGELLYLEPCYYLPHPFNPQPAFLVLCEVWNPDGSPHKSNTRLRLRNFVKREGGRTISQVGFRQGLDHSRSTTDWKAAQDHLLRCIDAGVMLHSARICLEQGAWWYKVGRRDFDEGLGQNHPLTMCDHLVLSRFMLELAAREAGAELELGGLQGAVYFSTADIREDSDVAVACADVIRNTPTTWWTPVVSTRTGYLELRGLKPLFDPYPVVSHLMETLSQEPQ